MAPAIESSINTADCKPGITSLFAPHPLVVISTPSSPMNVPANNLSLSVSKQPLKAGSWLPRVSFGGNVDYSTLCNLGDGDIGVLFLYGTMLGVCVLGGGRGGVRFQNTRPVGSVGQLDLWRALC